MLGWDEHSYGYHGDDGSTFHRGKSSSDEMNGALLMDSFHSIDKRVLRKGLYPTVGIDSKCPIHVNFGQVSFKFNVSFLRDFALYYCRPGRLE
eukprot:scaffold20276_cov224-Skeletonema_marinoi.AAC.11